MLVAAAGTVPAQTSRLDAEGNVREDAYIRIPLSEADQRYAAIDGAHLKDIVREVTDISLANRDDRTKYWGRIAGTRGEEMAREYVERRFRELGLTDIRDQVFDLPTQWFPAGHDIRVEAGERTYRFDSMVPALRSNPTDGTLDLEAVWVGTGSTADFLGRDVAGKAVFIHSIPAPGSMGHSAGASWEDAIRRAQDRGAAAVVVIYGSPRRWWVNGSDRLVDLVLDAYRTFGVAVWDRMEDRAAGEMGSVARDLPSVQIIRSPEIKHTDQDIPEWVPAAGLEAVARAYARIIDDVNQLDRAALLPGQTTDGQ